MTLRSIPGALANKGAASSELAQLVAIPFAEIAVIGDGSNDVAMFERSGLGATGNAAPARATSRIFLLVLVHGDDGYPSRIGECADFAGFDSLEGYRALAGAYAACLANREKANFPCRAMSHCEKNDVSNRGFVEFSLRGKLDWGPCSSIGVENA